MGCGCFASFVKIAPIPVSCTDAALTVESQGARRLVTFPVMSTGKETGVMAMTKTAVSGGQLSSVTTRSADSGQLWISVRGFPPSSLVSGASGT